MLVLALFAAGCGESAPPDNATTTREIDALVRQYHELLSKGDLPGVEALLAPEFGLSYSGQDPVYGRDNAMKVLGGFVDYYKAHDLLGKRQPMFGNIRIGTDGNVAWASYTVAFFESKDKPSVIESYLHLFKRTSGKWLFIFDHRAPR